MPVDIEEIIEQVLENAFAKAIESVIEQKAEELFRKAFANGSPFSERLQQKIEDGFDRFFQKGIRWEKKKAGFKGR